MPKQEMTRTVSPGMASSQTLRRTVEPAEAYVIGLISSLILESFLVELLHKMQICFSELFQESRVNSVTAPWSPVMIVADEYQRVGAIEFRKLLDRK